MGTLTMSHAGNLSPAARSMLEELESELNAGHVEKPRQVLRAMPTQILSDIEQVYEETRLRTEFKMSQVYQRASVCDGNIKAVGERRKDLLTEQHDVSEQISQQIEALREQLKEQERKLQMQLADMVRAKEAALDEQHNDLERRRARLVGMYREAEEYLNDGVHHKYEFIARTHEMESKMDAHIALSLDVDGLDLGLQREVPYAAAAHAVSGLVMDVDAYTPMSTPAPAALPSGSVNPKAASGFVSAAPVSPPRSPQPSLSASGTAMTPKDAVPNAVYVNGLAPDTTEEDIRGVFEHFGEIKMVNARHVSNGGFAFVFFKTEQGATAALQNPRVVVGDRTVNILAKKQILSGGGRWL